VEALAAGLSAGGAMGGEDPGADPDPDPGGGDAPDQARAAGALQLALAVMRRAAGFGARVRRACAARLLPAAAELVAGERGPAAELEPAVEAVQALLAACCARRSGRLRGGAAERKYASRCMLSCILRLLILPSISSVHHCVRYVVLGIERDGGSAAQCMVAQRDNKATVANPKIVAGRRAEGADAADAWTACQQQLLLLACRPHPALAALVGEAWGGIIGCARATGAPRAACAPCTCLLALASCYCRLPTQGTSLRC